MCHCSACKVMNVKVFHSVKNYIIIIFSFFYKIKSIVLKYQQKAIATCRHFYLFIYFYSTVKHINCNSARQNVMRMFTFAFWCLFSVKDGYVSFWVLAHNILSPPSDDNTLFSLSVDCPRTLVCHVRWSVWKKRKNLLIVFERSKWGCFYLRFFIAIFCLCAVAGLMKRSYSVLMQKQLSHQLSMSQPYCARCQSSRTAQLVSQVWSC